MYLHCYHFKPKLIHLHHNHRDPNTTDLSSIYLNNQQTNIHHRDPTCHSPHQPNQTQLAHPTTIHKLGFGACALGSSGYGRYASGLSGFGGCAMELSRFGGCTMELSEVWCICDEVVEVWCVCNEFTRFWWLCDGSLTMLCHLEDLC